MDGYPFGMAFAVFVAMIVGSAMTGLLTEARYSVATRDLRRFYAGKKNAARGCGRRRETRKGKPEMRQCRSVP
jgi:hypothetical protein